MDHDDAPIEAPIADLSGELRGIVRGVLGLPGLLASWPALPRGDGGPVLVLPGFRTADGSTLIMRGFLAGLGYDTYGWALGRNHGRFEVLMAQLLPRARQLARRAERPLRVVGWSYGGVLARELGHELPELVERIVTLGTPVVGGPKYTSAGHHYARRGFDLDELERMVAERNARSLAPPVTAIYSKRDSIVAWRACFDPNADNRVEHVEVDAGHLELGVSAAVLERIAAALAGQLTADR